LDLSSHFPFFDDLLTYDAVKEAAAQNAAATAAGTSSHDGNSSAGGPFQPLSTTETSLPQDLLTTRCRNQLALVHPNNKLVIASQNLPADCILDTPDLRNEVCERYRNAGCPGGYVVKMHYKHELRIFNTEGTSQIYMNRSVFDAIKR
jgi:hypothetical protein